jgi:cytidine deaminase
MSLSRKDANGISAAIHAASDSDLINFQLGACLATQQRLLISGSANTRSKAGRNVLSSIHAEMDAILRAKLKEPQRRNSCMYVVRVSKKSGKLGNAKPCNHCVLVMRYCGVKFCCWSTGNPDVSFRKSRVDALELDFLSKTQVKFGKIHRHRTFLVQPFINL